MDYQTGTGPEPMGAPTSPSADERQWAMFTHLSGLLCLTFVIPLILWQMKKDQSVYLDQQGKEAVNFQITFLGFFVICHLLAFLIIPPILAYLASIYWLVATILAGVKAYNNEPFKYPITLRLIK